MSNYYNRPPTRARPPERKRGCGCLGWAVALVWIALIGVVAYQYFLRDQISAYLGRQLGAQLQGQLGAQPTASAPLRPGEPTPLPGQPAPASPNSAIQDAQQALPTAIAALPSGELRFSETQVNTYIADHADQMKPLDGATMRFVPGEIQADIRALGTTSTVRTGLAVQNGQIIAVNPQAEGLLANAISVKDLLQPFQAQVNSQLAAQGRRVTDVRIEQGTVVLQISD